MHSIKVFRDSGSGWSQVLSVRVAGYIIDAVLSDDERYLYTATATGIQLVQLLDMNMQFNITTVGFIPVLGAFLS